MGGGDITAKVQNDSNYQKIMLSNFNPKNRESHNLKQDVSSKASFKITQIPAEYNLKMSEMESEAREHLNLALYNFNRMAVIDEEAIENHQPASNQRPTQISAE